MNNLAQDPRQVQITGKTLDQLRHLDMVLTTPEWPPVHLHSQNGAGQFVVHLAVADQLVSNPLGQTAIAATQFNHQPIQCPIMEIADSEYTVDQRIKAFLPRIEVNSFGFEAQLFPGRWEKLMESRPSTGI
jgi:hypothetical protein